jgi:hypothetical protein
MGASEDFVQHKNQKDMIDTIKSHLKNEVESEKNKLKGSIREIERRN